MGRLQNGTGNVLVSLPAAMNQYNQFENAAGKSEWWDRYASRARPNRVDREAIHQVGPATVSQNRALPTSIKFEAPKTTNPGEIKLKEVLRFVGLLWLWACDLIVIAIWLVALPWWGRKR